MARRPGGPDSAFSRLPLRRVEVAPDVGAPPPGRWPATVPAVARLLRDGLDLGPATVLVGENGTGKSTLVEAIAIAYGLSPEGGTLHSRNRTHESESDLHRHLRCVRGAGASHWGFFLRAETMHSFFTYQAIDAESAEGFHAMSHGESFRALLDSNRFVDRSGHPQAGLFVFDEPESALSFTAQLALLGQLLEMLSTGVAQVVLSTHSPVLAALPGARLLELTDEGWGERAWDDLELVEHYRRFLDGPERYLRHLR